MELKLKGGIVGLRIIVNEFAPGLIGEWLQKIGRPRKAGGVIGQISLLARQDLNNLPQADFDIRIEVDQRDVWWEIVIG